MVSRRLLIITTNDWFFISHRMVIAKEAVRQGWDVHVACNDTGRSVEIVSEGMQFIPFSFSPSGLNLLNEYVTLRRFRKLYKKVKPDVVHLITLKPVVYGSLAAKYLKINRVVCAVSGMGYVFINKKMGLVRGTILKLMKSGFNSSNVSVILQNNDDKEGLVNKNVIGDKASVHLIKGSGVDLDMFSYSPLPKGDKIKILFSSRMLWDKGVRELREASDILKEKYKNNIQFVLLGMADEGNKACVSESYMREWEDEDYVVWVGYHTNVQDYYRDSHIAVLPSYREGLPKALIEACATGRPIVTTDAVGCRDCVDEGINGLKVPVKDGLALANALERLVNDRSLMEKMGKAGRSKAEIEFDVKDVVKKHMEIYTL